MTFCLDSPHQCTWWKQLPSLMCCTAPVTSGIYIPTAVAALSSPVHQQMTLWKSFSITADKYNSCRDFLHSKTDTVPGAKRPSPSSSPPLSAFTSVTNLSCSQICEISATDYARLVAEDVRGCPIRSWSLPESHSPQHCSEENCKRKLREIANSALIWASLHPKLLVSCMASSNLHLK